MTDLITLTNITVTNWFAIGALTIFPTFTEKETNWVRIADAGTNHVEAAQVTEKHWLDVNYAGRTNRFLLLSQPQTNGVTEVRTVPKKHVSSGQWFTPPFTNIWEIDAGGPGYIILTNVIEGGSITATNPYLLLGDYGITH